MPRFLAPEVVAKVRELYEGTSLTHARIAAKTGVGASTVAVLAEKWGWTRHPEARRSPQLRGWKRAAIVSLREAGAPAGVIAEAAGCHRNTVGRIAPLKRPAAPAVAPDHAAEAGVPPIPPVPEHLADLHAALMSPELRKEEAAPLILRAAAALGAEALVRQDPQVERTGQILARLAERVAALPDLAPHPGAGADDGSAGPATFEETNALLEELARRFEAWNPEEDRAAAAGGRALDEFGASL
jgi:hypothetical protein